MALRAILGDELLKDGKKTNIDTVLEGKKLVCLYFSAHWCPPCRNFTPVLAAAYENKPDDLEIVFVSLDKNESGFTEYFKAMPWYAVPYEKLATLKPILSDKYKVTGIPALVVISHDGEVKVSNGRAHVEKNSDLKFQSDSPQ